MAVLLVAAVTALLRPGTIAISSAATRAYCRQVIVASESSRLSNVELLDVIERAVLSQASKSGWTELSRVAEFVRQESPGFELQSYGIGKSAGFSGLLKRHPACWEVHVPGSESADPSTATALSEHQVQEGETETREHESRRFSTPLGKLGSGRGKLERLSSEVSHTSM